MNPGKESVKLFISSLQNLLKFQDNFLCNAPGGGCFQWEGVSFSRTLILVTSNDLIFSPFVNVSAPSPLKVVFRPCTVKQQLAYVQSY